MSCCGKKRAAISNPLSSTPINQPAINPIVWFQYTGTTVLFITGKATHLPYRFFHNGALQAVDVRDSVMLDNFPDLQRVNEPRNQWLG